MKLALAVVAAMALGGADAFAPGSVLPRSDRGILSLSAARGTRAGGLGLRAARAELTPVETKAVQRFTKDFDKLCKTCPSRIQPRADTLTEMILGLPDDEQKLLLAKVALRLAGHDMATIVGSGAAAPVAVEAAAAVAAAPGMVPQEAMMGEKKMVMEDKKMMGMDKMEEKRMKLERKIRERQMDAAMYRAELEYLDLALVEPVTDCKARAQELLQKESGFSEMEMQEMVQEVSMKLEKLKGMDEAMQAIRALKLKEKIAKCARKEAECRAELAALAAPAVAC
eukprot:CAMPEP_0206244336 /NCGR_PEP_ID=MMETSP0047_2-20121206/18103_1 /ASSEMBLY_ACC=CAM_ASM_000192 /TAXON_ID=195065 /ORGANISM="Chroomonas mesostigmatica_cf, Strain CCMP1168" /LENGTH=282 /DNA_ID=CAMNT_0053669549 /DNA_START=89 /DNA_END=937 /DNA_ORIENTATION=+